MASVMRPSMLRQTCTKVSARSIFISQAFVPSLAIKTTTPQTPLIATRNLSPQSTPSGNVPGLLRLAAFHTTTRRPILPAGPQRIQGTANDPAPVPDPSPTHGSYHWTFERLVSAGLIPLTIAPFIGGSLNPVTDAVLCAGILIHSHIGFESIITDYVPAKRIPKTRFVFNWGLRAATILVGVGLYEFETNDVGVTEAIKRIWTA